MLTNTQLDERLEQWRKEYGGEDYAPSGRNIIQQLIDHKGFVPSGRGYVPVPIHTAADEVEAGVHAMQNTVGEPGAPNVYFRAAMVIRCDVLTPRRWPESERLRKLKELGLDMSRHTYYRALQFGRAFLMGYLARSEPTRTTATASTVA